MHTDLVMSEVAVKRGVVHFNITIRPKCLQVMTDFSRYKFGLLNLSNGFSQQNDKLRHIISVVTVYRFWNYGAPKM